MTTHQLIPAKPAVTASPSFVPVRGGLLQRKCACGGTPGASGECAECGKKKRNLQREANDKTTHGGSISPSRVPALQRKLTIGTSNDPLEREADRVAEQVLAAPEHPAVSVPPLKIQRFTGQSTGIPDTATVRVDRILASPGRPLDAALQADMSQRFGHDFLKVRVHSDPLAEQSARDINAQAYVSGHDIVFGAGRWAPGTTEGRRLIAHELTHVVQQSEGSLAIQRSPDSEAEREAARKEAVEAIAEMDRREALDDANEKEQEKKAARKPRPLPIGLRTLGAAKQLTTGLVLHELV